MNSSSIKEKSSPKNGIYSAEIQKMMPGGLRANILLRLKRYIFILKCTASGDLMFSSLQMHSS